MSATPPTSAVAENTERRPMGKVIAGSLAGAFLEWYDFNLYGLSAALVFNKLFFPSLSPAAGTLASLASFGTGFILRPIGGIVFGHFGDRVGRKTTLVATMLIMGLSTFLVGLLPTYATVGVWAPVLLVVLRLVQGFGLGGEYGGASLLAVESAPQQRRGLWGSLPQCGAPLGYLVATGAFSAVAALPHQELTSWGWRVPFLVSAILLVVGLIVRLRLLETPDFVRVRSAKAQARVPFLRMFAEQPRVTLATLGARLVEGISSNIFQPFTIAYIASSLGMAQSVGLVGAAIYNVIILLLLPLAGALSDRIGRRRMYLAGIVLVGVLAFPFVLVLHTKIVGLIWLAMGVAAVCSVPLGAVQATFFTELFRTRVRYSGLSLAYQLSAVLAGFSPSLALAWATSAHGTWPAAAYLVGIAAVSLVCTLLLSETRSAREETIAGAG